MITRDKILKRNLKSLVITGLPTYKFISQFNRNFAEISIPVLVDNVSTETLLKEFHNQLVNFKLEGWKLSRYIRYNVEGSNLFIVGVVTDNNKTEEGVHKFLDFISTKFGVSILTGDTIQETVQFNNPTDSNIPVYLLPVAESNETLTSVATIDDFDSDNLAAIEDEIIIKDDKKIIVPGTAGLLTAHEKYLIGQIQYADSKKVLSYSEGNISAAESLTKRCHLLLKNVRKVDEFFAFDIYYNDIFVHFDCIITAANELRTNITTNKQNSKNVVLEPDKLFTVQINKLDSENLLGISIICETETELFINSSIPKNLQVPEDYQLTSEFISNFDRFNINETSKGLTKLQRAYEVHTVLTLDNTLPSMILENSVANDSIELAETTQHPLQGSVIIEQAKTLDYPTNLVEYLKPTEQYIVELSGYNNQFYTLKFNQHIWYGYRLGTDITWVYGAATVDFSKIDPNTLPDDKQFITKELLEKLKDLGLVYPTDADLPRYQSLSDAPKDGTICVVLADSENNGDSSIRVIKKDKFHLLSGSAGSLVCVKKDDSISYYIKRNNPTKYNGKFENTIDLTIRKNPEDYPTDIAENDSIQIGFGNNQTEGTRVPTVLIGTGLKGYDNVLVLGKYNDKRRDVDIIIGNGIDDSSRSNIVEITHDSVKIFGRLSFQNGPDSEVVMGDGTTITVDELLEKQSEKIEKTITVYTAVDNTKHTNDVKLTDWVVFEEDLNKATSGSEEITVLVKNQKYIKVNDKIWVPKNIECIKISEEIILNFGITTAEHIGKTFANTNLPSYDKSIIVSDYIEAETDYRKAIYQDSKDNYYVIKVTKNVFN